MISGDKVKVMWGGVTPDSIAIFIGFSKRDPEYYIIEDMQGGIHRLHKIQVKPLRVGYVSLWDYKSNPGQIHAGTVYDTFAEALREDRSAANGSYRIGTSKVEY